VVRDRKMAQEERSLLSRRFEEVKQHFHARAGIWDMLVEGLVESNKKRPAHLRRMAEHGWYLSPNFTIPSIPRIADGLEKDRSKMEEELCTYFENRIDEIDQYVRTEYPHRHAILSEAFWAHKQGKFSLTIPVLLSQAEGMCVETFDEKLYSKRDHKPRLATILSRYEPGTFLDNVVLQMIEPFPIAGNDKTADPDHLNRHRVIHGIDCRYGTRMNSCKAISLIDYVSWACKTVGL